MYLLINPDGTVNFADDHPIREGLHRDGLQLVELPDKSLSEVVGDIPPDEALWDPERQAVIRDPLLVSVAESEAWRQQQARSRILQFYPLWKQLNILREGDGVTIATMGKFIDACRAWSNDPQADPDQLNQIVP